MWGEGAIDATKDYTPMNEAKAEFAWWSIVTDVLHDSLVLCNWVWPMAMAPEMCIRDRGSAALCGSRPRRGSIALPAAAPDCV